MEEGRILHYRNSANEFLSRFEPIVLLVSPILTLLLARFVHLVLCFVRENGLRGPIVQLGVKAIKLIPCVKKYIEGEKKKVVEKLSASVKSKKENWRSELPRVGLGSGVLEELEAEKRKDVAWREKCSGTVYIGGHESEGHFALTNDAYSIFCFKCLAQESRTPLKGCSAWSQRQLFGTKAFRWRFDAQGVF